MSSFLLHLFALFRLRLIEDAATCVWGSLATRIVAPVAPFSIPPSFPLLSPKGKLGVDAWYWPKQVPLAETDKSASNGADPSCHGQVRSAAADVVACHINCEASQRG